MEPHPTDDGPVLVRVDAMSIALALTEFDGTRLRISPDGPVTAVLEPTLPLFANWSARASLSVSLQGVATGAFEARLVVDGRPVGAATTAQLDAESRTYRVDLLAPLADAPAQQPADVPRGRKLGVHITPGDRVVTLTRVKLAPVAGPAPGPAAFDLRDRTDTLLFDAPERKLFDLQNPEEGFWLGTGIWRLRMMLDWSATRGGTAPDAWALDPKPARLEHNHRAQGAGLDVLYEDLPKRAGDGNSTVTELVLDTGHASVLGKVPPEGMDLPVLLRGEHVLKFGARAARWEWARDVSVRMRDPSPLLPTFKRLSSVGVDFGTSATVAAFTHRGYRSLMRLGSPPEGINAAENPTVLLIEDHEKLWQSLAQCNEQMPPGKRRFPHIVGLVRAAHAARAEIEECPNAVVGQIKSLPERVILLDQSPQLRDRARHADFLLDEARVRMLIHTYAHILGRAINRPGQDVFLQYWLTYPAEFDDRMRDLLEHELRAGILLSIPEGIPASEVVVRMCATEPEAYAAEVCPELVNHPAVEAIVSRFGELRFAVFDFGGGTLDIACGRYRPATDAESTASGCSSVIETLQVAGNDHLGGDYLTQEFAWLSHQYEPNLAEMEAKDVPMQRPQTIPENKLARKPHLYKRSLAARQNQIRFERELSLEQLKFKKSNTIRKVDKLAAVRVDGTETTVESFGKDGTPLRTRLVQHLEERIAAGARLLASMLASTPWGGTGSWQEQGVLILLAGNSSRGEYVEHALGAALGLPDLKVWRPDSATPLQNVVLYETAPRQERGIQIIGVSPKTAVALGALKIANREVHLVRAAQGFSYFVGDMRGFPPRFFAHLAMGTAPANADEWGPHYVDFGTWDAQKPLRVCTEYEQGKMSSNDPRLLTIPTGLPAGTAGRLYVCVTSPTRIGLHLALADGQNHVRAEINLAPYLS